MKKIKSKHLWRRGATLLLAMLMLFTCVGSALPAFAEEATGNTATVDSGDPVLADSSAGGDSTGDTDADLPDDTPQRPTLPSGEDISEETPPADESDGETVPPADSDSSEEPAAPDSGDSIPDESESEPTEQPGEGDADLPEDEQPGGEEPDPDEDEEIPEDEPEDVPFEALVISNLPCIFDTTTRNGVLKARVYTPEGREVTEYGVIRVNVDRDFWDNDMTIPLYLGNFTVEPVSDEQTYESAQAFFSATTTASEKPSLVGWEYRKDESDTWQAIPGDWDVSLSNEERITADGDHLLTTKLTLNNADPAWDGYEFRAVFSSPSFGQWNTYEYWLQGAVASGTETPGSVHKPVNRPNFTGELAVYLWPAYAQQGADQTTYAGAKATFSATRPSFWTRRITAAAVFGAQEQKS